MISETRPVAPAASPPPPGPPGAPRSRSVTRRTGGTAPRSRRGLREQKTVHRLPLAGGKVPVKRPVPQTLVPLGRGKVLPLGQPLPHRMAPFGGELPKVSHELLDGPLLLRPGGPVDLAPLHQEVPLSLREFPPTFPPFEDSLLAFRGKLLPPAVPFADLLPLFRSHGAPALELLRRHLSRLAHPPDLLP